MLIACLACGKRISDRAPACPFCGAKAAAPAVSELHPRGAPAVSSLAPEAAPSVVAPGPDRTGAAGGAEPLRSAPRPAPVAPATAEAPVPAPAPTAVAPTPRFQRGDFIGGELQVLEVLGEGGFGIVYLAASQKTGQLLAVKALRSELLRDARVVEMFRKEARIWIELGRHPFLVKAVWVEEIGGRLYLAMEYVRGRPGQANSLEGVLLKGPPPIETAVQWAVEFCHGMEHAISRGIRCHRDIKPANVLIAEDGKVRISDFGIAGLALQPETAGSRGVSAPAGGNPDRTVAGTVFGTPTHMSPEQFEDAASCDERSDVYSFGVVLHQLTTAQLPFHPGPPPAGVDPATHYWLAFRRLHREAQPAPVESPLAPLIARCLRKARAERYASFRELRGDLETLYQKLTGEPAPGLGTAEESVADLVNRGLSLSSLGRHQEALECYERALVLAPDEKALHNNKGNVLRLLGRTGEALASLERALALDPSFDDAWYNKGLLFTEAGRLGEALHAFERALAANVRSIPAWIGKGHVLGRLGRAAEELQCLDRAIEIDPRDPIAWFNKGHLFSESDREQTLACYDRALQANPRYTEAWGAKAVVLAEAGRHAEALACFDEGLSIDPQSPQLHYNKGNVLAATGRFAEAQACFDAATRRPGCPPVAWYNRALAEHQLERFDAALASLREFVKRTTVADPLLPGAQALVRKLEAGDHAPLRPKAADRRVEASYETVAIAEAPAASAPGSPPAAPAAQSAAEPAPPPSPPGSQAAPAAPPAPPQPPHAPAPTAAAPPAPAPRSPRPPGTAESWNQRAAALHRDGRFAEAAEAAENALRLDPQNATALNNLATCLFAAGRGQEALARLEGVLLMSPDHLDAWFNKAVIESRLGREPDALRSMLEILELARDGRAPQLAARAQAARADLERQGVQPSPRNDLGWLAVGFQAVVAGRPDDALAAFDRAIAGRPDVAELWEWKGAALREQDRLDESLACFDSAVQGASASATVHHGRAMTLVKLRRFEDAVAAFDQALAIDPEHAASWSDRGKTLGVLKRNEEALDSFAHAAALAPENPAPWQNQALIADGMGRPEEALRLYREFLRWARPDMRLQVEHAKARVQVLEARLGAAPPPAAAPRVVATAGHLDAVIKSLVAIAGLPEPERAAVESLRAAGRREEALVRLAGPEAAARYLASAGDAADLDALTEALLERAKQTASAPPAVAPPPPESPVDVLRKDPALRGLIPFADVSSAEMTEIAARMDGGRDDEAFNRLAQAEARAEAARGGPTAEEEAQSKAALDALMAMVDERVAEQMAREGAPKTAPPPPPAAKPVRPGSPVARKYAERAAEEIKAGEHAKALESLLAVRNLDPLEAKPIRDRLAALRPKPTPSSTAAPENEPIPEAVVPNVLPTRPPPDCQRRGEMALAQGQPDRAVEWFDQWITAEPRSYNAWAGKAEALYALRRYVESVSQMSKALEINPRFVQGWQRKAQALDAAGRHEESLAAWEKGLELAAKNIHLLNGRGLALLALGRAADALPSFDQALAVDPRFSLARYNKARAEERLGRAADAARSYQQFLGVAPPHLVAQIQDARQKVQELKPA